MLLQKEKQSIEEIGKKDKKIYERRKKTMKTRFMHIATNVCSLTLALMPYFYYKGSSIIFFGEPKYPCAKKSSAE